ncbi:MAG: SRPBCC domain-containing protein [Actinomycetota bacterium]
MTDRHEEHRVSARADLDDVWRLLTTAEGLTAWFGTESSIDLRLGGGVEIGWGGDERIVGEIGALEAPHRLRVAYVEHGEEVGAEEWLLSHDDGVTHVRLIHSMPDPGVDDWEGFYGDYRRGWRLFLTSLRFAAELGGDPRRAVDSRYVPAPAGREATWASCAAELAANPPGADHVELVADRPHQLVLADETSTVLFDLEGGGEGLVCYVQVASHGSERDDEQAARWRSEVLSRLTGAVPG